MNHQGARKNQRIELGIKIKKLTKRMQKCSDFNEKLKLKLLIESLQKQQHKILKN